MPDTELKERVGLEAPVEAKSWAIFMKRTASRGARP